MDTHRIISAERRRLAPHIERVNGFNARGDFLAGFEREAGRFALGRVDETQFRTTVGEMIRDAAGVASGQDREADDRQPWATMPTDGSGRLARWQWALVGAVMAACFLATVRIAGLIWQDWSTADVPGKPVPVTITGVPAGAGDPDRDAARELIIEGAYLSWQAQDGCAQGPAECERILREVNVNPYGVRFFEDGSAFVPGRQ